LAIGIEEQPLQQPLLAQILNIGLGPIPFLGSGPHLALGGGLPVIVVLSNRPGPIEGIDVGALILVGPLLELGRGVQGLPALAALASRVSSAIGAGIEGAVHRSTHHGYGWLRFPHPGWTYGGYCQEW